MKLCARSSDCVVCCLTSALIPMGKLQWHKVGRPCAGALIASGPGGVVLGGSLVFPCFSVYPTLWGVGAGEQGAVED